MLTLRGVRFLFGLGRGKEGLGIGDADVMMMAGSFLGWQPTLVAFFVGVFAALFFGVAQLVRKGDQALAFAPALAVGVMTTLLTWPAISRNPSFLYLFSEAWILGALAGAGAVFLLLASFLLRIIRGSEPPQPEPGQEVKAEATAAAPWKPSRRSKRKAKGAWNERHRDRRLRHGQSAQRPEGVREGRPRGR